MLVPDGSEGVQPLSGLPASARPTEAALPGALPSPEAGSVRRPRRPVASVGGGPSRLPTNGLAPWRGPRWAAHPPPGQARPPPPLAYFSPDNRSANLSPVTETPPPARAGLCPALSLSRLKSPSPVLCRGV